MPEEINFTAKPEIALKHLRGACEAAAACGVVLTDAGYGAGTPLCANNTTLD
jgi:SRSO17 transposase